MYLDTDTIDLIDKLVRIIGWPTLLGALVWIVRKWDKGQADFTEVCANTRTAVSGVAEVKAQVDKIQTNHFAHLQDSMQTLVQQSSKQVEILTSVDKNIAVLGAKLDATRLTNS
jgi:hypothetical protein